MIIFVTFSRFRSALQPRPHGVRQENALGGIQNRERWNVLWARSTFVVQGSQHGESAWWGRRWERGPARPDEWWEAIKPKPKTKPPSTIHLERDREWNRMKSLSRHKTIHKILHKAKKIQIKKETGLGEKNCQARSPGKRCARQARHPVPKTSKTGCALHDHFIWKLEVRWEILMRRIVSQLKHDKKMPCLWNRRDQRRWPSGCGWFGVWEPAFGRIKDQLEKGKIGRLWKDLRNAFVGSHFAYDNLHLFLCHDSPNAYRGYPVHFICITKKSMIQIDRESKGSNFDLLVTRSRKIVLEQRIIFCRYFLVNSLFCSLFVWDWDRVPPPPLYNPPPFLTPRGVQIRGGITGALREIRSLKRLIQDKTGSWGKHCSVHAHRH